MLKDIPSGRDGRRPFPGRRPSGRWGRLVGRTRSLLPSVSTAPLPLISVSPLPSVLLDSLTLISVSSPAQQMRERIMKSAFTFYATSRLEKLAKLCVHVLMRDEKKGRKKQARSRKQQGKATQHTQGSHFSYEK